MRKYPRTRKNIHTTERGKEKYVFSAGRARNKSVRAPEIPADKEKLRGVLAVAAAWDTHSDLLTYLHSGQCRK